jgi:hypothetical protein
VNRSTLCRILTFFLLLPAIGLAAPGEKPVPAAEPAAAPVLRETRLDEPIFKGQAAIYEGGAANPRSVVLVHGVGDNAARDWDRLIPELVKEYHVLRSTSRLRPFEQRNEVPSPTTRDSCAG